MRPLLTCLLITASCLVKAQTSVHSNLSTSINDDDKTYSIRIDGDRNGREIHYNRSFNGVGLSREQKEAIKNRVLDSLGLGEAPPPPARLTTKADPELEKVTFICTTCTGRAKLSITGDGFSADREVEIDKDKPGFPFELDMKPGTYSYTYWQNSVQQMQLPFTVKAGQENRISVK